jgi:hypothetical protein
MQKMWPLPRRWNRPELSHSQRCGSEPPLIIPKKAGDASKSACSMQLDVSTQDAAKYLCLGSVRLREGRFERLRCGGAAVGLRPATPPTCFESVCVIEGGCTCATNILCAAMTCRSHPQCF